MNNNNERPCLQCPAPLGCGTCRGLCYGCYRKMGKSVKNGHTTWEKLIRLNRALRTRAEVEIERSKREEQT